MGSYKQKECDYGHTVQKGYAKRLDTGGGSGVYLCRKHWAKEMQFRRQRNKSLEGDAKFPIKKF